MGEYKDLILEGIFEFDLEQDLMDLAEDIYNQIIGDKELEVDECTANEPIVINYSPEDKLYDLKDALDKSIALAIATGLPNEIFDEAESEYKELINEPGQQEYILEGDLARGSLAQYAAVMSIEEDISYQAITYNSLGIKSFAKFRGNEFLGYKLGVLYYLDNVVNGRKSSESILNILIDKEIIKYGNISNEYRKDFNETLDVAKMRDALIEVFKVKLNLAESEVKELVEENFNPELIERKMRFIDKYQKYQNSDRDIARNYLLSDNLAARSFEHLAKTYLVDKNLKPNQKATEKLYLSCAKLEAENIAELIKSNNELFAPYILLEKGGNGKRAKNRLSKKAEVGEISNNLSFDYLAALIKDIIKDLNNADEEILVEIFKICQRSSDKEFIKVISDRLEHSMYLRGVKKEAELNYRSSLLEDNPDLFASLDKTYRLDRAVIEQLDKRMTAAELKDLWQWKLSGEGIFIILGKEVDEDKVIEYHSLTKSFDNQQEELEIELEEPSQNKIYGSLKKSPNYRAESDKHYHHQEDEAYNFSSQQGPGFFISDRQVDPDKEIKVDGEAIGGVYDELDYDEAELGEQKESRRDKYFSNSIILRDYKKRFGELSGTLIYLYGDEKKDQLVIEGFKNGDYGIELETEAKDDKEESNKTYTPHKIKFDNFEFVDLERFELSKAIYQHTRLRVKGLIKAELAQEYLNYLAADKPVVEISYHDDESKILFKGFIEDYKIINQAESYQLEFKAVSYSRLLEHRLVDRIFQDQTTTYGDIFTSLEDDNQEFNISFADDELEEETLEQPFILQYQESEWDFLRRIIAKSKQPLIVDDTKDDSEKINLLAGSHDNANKELNNKKGRLVKNETVGGKQAIYYQINAYLYSEQQDIFNLGESVEYNLGNQGQESQDLIVLKNTIYLKDGLLYSDLKLAVEADFKAKKIKRRTKITGVSLLAEVKEVLEDQHRAKVEFINLEDDFDSEQAYEFPLDKVYTNSYLAPEEEDIVDVYLKGEKEGATIKSCNSNQEDEIENQPEDKILFTPAGYQIKINDEEIKLNAPDENAIIKLAEDEIELSLEDSKIVVDDEGLELKTEDAEIELSSSELEAKLDSRSVKLTSSGIDFD